MESKNNEVESIPVSESYVASEAGPVSVPVTERVEMVKDQGFEYTMENVNFKYEEDSDIDSESDSDSDSDRRS